MHHKLLISWVLAVVLVTIFCLWLLLYILHSVGGQSCIQNVNVQRIGLYEMNHNRLGIVPHLSFHCNVRITGIRVRLTPDKERNNYPYIQVWRPLSQDSTSFTKIAQVQVDESHIVQLTYVEANIPLTGNNRILVQSGDIIGYYHPRNARYRVRTIETVGYAQYLFDGVDGSTATSVDLNNANHRSGLRHPLISFRISKWVGLSYGIVSRSGKSVLNKQCLTMCSYQEYY